MEQDLERRRVTLRDGPDGRLFAEWYIGTGASYFFRVFTDEELLFALERPELPHAARALRKTLNSENESVTVRDLGLEKVWFEADSGYVTVSKGAVGGEREMTLLAEEEARKLLKAVETAIDQFGDVEDDPYV